MFTQSRYSISAVIALAMFAGSGAFAADTVSQQDVTDARQETQIWTTYALSPYLRANDLKVSVRNGKATLTGKVEEGVSKDLAKQIALGVNGIKDVDNQIVVQAGYSPPARSSSSERSFGEVIDDATITSSVKSKLAWSRYADATTTDVDTKRGKVKLHGTASSAESKELAGRLAMNTRDVVSVDNQLIVKGTKQAVADTAKAPAHDSGQGIADGWITTKVKSTFMYSSNVEGSDISVSTADGVVTLNGKVDSGAQRELAIELAKNVRGVKTVQSKGLTL